MEILNLIKIYPKLIFSDWFISLTTNFHLHGSSSQVRLQYLEKKIDFKNQLPFYDSLEMQVHNWMDGGDGVGI